jgi:hypothetical protein
MLQPIYAIPCDYASDVAAASAAGRVKHNFRARSSVVDLSRKMKVRPRRWLSGWIVLHSAWVRARFSVGDPAKRSAPALACGLDNRGDVGPFQASVITKKTTHRGKNKGKLSSTWLTSIAVGKEGHAGA